MRKLLKIILRCFLFIILTAILLFLLWYLVRVFSEKQVDDVTPGIYCEKDIINKSQSLAVVPIFKNVSIALNKSWCEYILSLNKTLVMHGVYHSYNEFYTLRDTDYLQLGKEEFRKCFGFYPTIFEAPQLALSRENRNIISRMGFRIRGNIYQTTHKVYHCSDTGLYSNKAIDLF